MNGNYRNPLPGVPIVESPFFDELFDPADPLFPVARALSEDGFAVLDFPDDGFDAVSERIRSSLHPAYDWTSWNAGAGADMRIQDAWRSNDDVRRIAANPAIIDILGRLYGRRAFPFQTLSFPVGTQQHFHTDSVHFSCRPERFMCGVWVAMEDIGPDNGPLVYYPGSHRWPIYTREHIGISHSAATGSHQSAFEPLWERLVEKYDAKPAYFHAKKGQALIWAANLLHGGAPHRNRALTRWSQVTHYYFEDCVYYTPLGSNEPAAEMLVRRPEDIVTSRIVQPSYHGEPLSDAVVDTLNGNRRHYPQRFDPARYLEIHPDVAAAGMDAWQHYDRYGRSEGRRLD